MVVVMFTSIVDGNQSDGIHESRSWRMHTIMFNRMITLHFTKSTFKCKMFTNCYNIIKKYISNQ